MTTLLRTAADFDAVPDDALILTIEIVLPDVPHGRHRKIWRKYGRHFVQLDPGDRTDGEETKESGYLENLLTGFGNKRTTPGVGLLLDAGDVILAETVADLPQDSIVQLPNEECPHTYSGGDRWEYMDPGDVYDGDYPTTTAELISGETTIQVLYRPGDEELSGFTIEPTPEERGRADAAPTGVLSVDEVVERAIGKTDAPPEPDIDALSPRALTSQPDFEGALSQYAKVYSFLHSQVEIDLVQMSSEELRAFGAALDGPTPTNCGFEFYRVAQILRPLYDGEVHRRAREEGDHDDR